MRSGSEWFGAEVIESDEDRCHRGVGVAEADAAAEANENPAEAFEDGLTCEVVLELSRGVPLLAVALDGAAFRESFDNKINSASTDGPLRLHAVSRAHKTLPHQLLENGVKFPRFCGLDCGEHHDSHEQQQQNRSALRSGV